jgi:O-antigen/teichoic acid export membrane protein
VLTVLAAPFFDRLFPGVQFLPYGLLALGITATTAFQYIPSSLFRATERPDRFVVFALGVFGVVVVATLLFLVVLQLGAVGGLLAQLASGIAVVAITIVILGSMRRGRPDRELANRALRFGLPLVPHGLAAWVLNLSDRWLIGLLIGLSGAAAQTMVGIYAFGYVIGQSVGLVAFSFNAAWVPFWYARGDTRNGPRILREMSTSVIGGLGFLAVAVAVLAPEVTELLAVSQWGEQAREAAEVIPVVAVASLVYGVYFMVVSTIFLRRKTAGLPLLTLLAGATNVGVNILLIPRLGIMGAAWATLAGYGMLAAATWWYGSRVYPIRLDLPRLAAIGGLTVAAIVVARLADIAVLGVWPAAGIHAAVIAAAGIGLIWLLWRPLRELRDLVNAADDGPDGDAGVTATMQPPKEPA